MPGARPAVDGDEARSHMNELNAEVSAATLKMTERCRHAKRRRAGARRLSGKRSLRFRGCSSDARRAVGDVGVGARVVGAVARGATGRPASGSPRRAFAIGGRALALAAAPTAAPRRSRRSRRRRHRRGSGHDSSRGTSDCSGGRPSDGRRGGSRGNRAHRVAGAEALDEALTLAEALGLGLRAEKVTTPVASTAAAMKDWNSLRMKGFSPKSGGSVAATDRE